MTTHPDAVGSNKYLESYLKLRGQYEEARCYLEKSQNTKNGQKSNHRLAFFEKLSQIESMEMPYAFHPNAHLDEVASLKRAAIIEISCWKRDFAGLYGRANEDYVRIKAEKPRGPYLRHALALNVRPLVHNLIAYHLTGRELYARQARQNVSGIMQRLAENGCAALREFLALLLDDMKNGPAVLE